MTTLHPTTVALLEAADAWETTVTVLEAVGRWRNAGCPDLTPTPDRLAELEARIAAIDNWVKILNEQHAFHASELSGHRTGTASAIMRLTDRIKALEAPTPAPKPPRFVPTEPGWYWRRDNDLRIVVRVIDDPNGRKALTWCWGAADTLPVVDDGLWLAPVAPYAPSTRTEAEARAKPMRGDRWATRMGRKYTLTRPPPEERSGWFACWEGMEEGYGFSPGFPDETYLGNFAHELDK